MGQRKSTVRHDGGYDPYYNPNASRLEFLPHFYLPPLYNLAAIEARLQNNPYIVPTAHAAPPMHVVPTAPAEYAAPPMHVAQSIYATPAGLPDQNIPKKTNDCKPCASVGQKHVGTGILTNKGKVEAKAFPLPEQKPETSKVTGAVTAVKAVNTFKQKSPKKILEKAVIDKPTRTQKEDERVKKPETYVSKERPETYVPSKRPERCLPSEKPERCKPSEKPEIYVPSVKAEKYGPNERSEKYIPREKSKRCHARDNGSSSSDNDDDGDDDDDVDGDDGHSNIVPKFRICLGGSCCPASPQGKNLLSNEINWRQFRAMPPHMTRHHCRVSCHSYHQRFIDWNQRTTYLDSHRCKTNHNSSFFIPNTPLTPVLCPPSSVNFGPGNTRTNVLDTGRNSSALDVDGFCETIRELADILGPDDDKVLDDVIDQLTSGNFK